MKSVILLALFAMLAAANAGLIAAPAVGLVRTAPVVAAAPVAYAPLTYAAVPTHVNAYIPATIHTRTYHGNGAPVFGPAPLIYG